MDGFEAVGNSEEKKLREERRNRAGAKGKGKGRSEGQRARARAGAKERERVSSSSLARSGEEWFGGQGRRTDRMCKWIQRNLCRRR
jgi:hypothetical protein